MTIIHADCVEAMRGMVKSSVHAIVTDPPYALEFMGKGWDKVLPSVDVWRECLQVLKPGGHLLAFGGTRTYHRLTCAIEDAGFEIRDCLMWIYGTGFPKSLDVSKAIDKVAGVEFTAKPASGVGFMGPDGPGGYNVTKNQLTRKGESTEAARYWSGYGTALKPAWEPIVVARRPLVGTVAANVLEHGAGAINVDGCRIGTETRINPPAHNVDGSGWGMRPNIPPSEVQGRWPANVVLDEAAAEQLGEPSRFFFVAARSDEEWLALNLNLDPASIVETGLSLQSESVASALSLVAVAALQEGKHASVTTVPSTSVTPRELRQIAESVTEAIQFTAKEFWQELPHSRPIPNRDPVRFVIHREQTDIMTITISHWRSDGSVDPVTFSITPRNSDPGAKDSGPSTDRFKYCAKASKKERGEGNRHPCVKPIALMRWLVRLVTPPENGIVLDPFLGSGSTGVACRAEGVDFVGIEREAEYVEIARRRIEE